MVDRLAQCLETGDALPKAVGQSPTMACIAAARDRAAACHTKLRRSHGWIMLTRVRHGHEIRLVIPGLDPASIQQRDPKLIALVADAIAIRDAVLARPDAAFSVIATALGKCRKRMAQLMPLAWLAPDIVEAIVAGTQPADLTHRRLMNIRIPIRWEDQRRVLRFG